MEVISRILKDIFFTLEYQIPKYSFVRDHKSFCFKNHSNIKTIIIHLHPESTLLLEQLCIFSGHPPLQTINSISSHKHINCIISGPLSLSPAKPNRPEGPLFPEEIRADHVKLKWKKPKDDGGLPIEGYVIEKMDMDTGTWVPAGEVSRGSFRFSPSTNKASTVPLPVFRMSPSSPETT